ncbi:MAG: hypothetical protein ACTSO9_11330 [Candidatus Helarchaeota archaeon]
MIIGILKEARPERNNIPSILNVSDKQIVSGDEVIFALKIKKKSEKLDYEINFFENEEDIKKKFYIYNKSDIVANININGFNFLIISGNVESYIRK